MSGGGGTAESLNAAQRRAVEHDGGPLIVLAGPGTGKTRVITHRVAHMIRERGIEPERISLTTFSVKAAEEMRSRLTELLGEVLAQRVQAQTTHGLGRSILRRFADRLDLPPLAADPAARGPGRRSELIDTAQSRRLMRRLILDENLFGHARAGGIESIMADAEALFSRFALLGLGPDEVEERLARWDRALAEGRTADGRTLDGPALAASSAARERIGHFAALYRLLERERRAAGLLTFDDLILLPIRLLRDHPAVRDWCRTEYRHWLVDEFQDVNVAQIELLRLLAPPETPGGPDLCVVGDDDQAIYGFRGADDHAFGRFAAIWAGTRVIPLTENHRSRPRIIDVANSVISRAEERFAPDKRTGFPAGKAPDPPGIVECVDLRHEFEDAEAIAAMIRRDVASDASGIDRPYARFAVIARTHNDLDRVQAALYIEGIPTLRWGRDDDLESEPGVRDVLAWARLIVNPRDSWQARRLLLRPPISLPLEQVNDLERRYRAAASRARFGGERGDGAGSIDPGPYAVWLRGHAADEPMIARFCDWHDQFARLAMEETAPAVLMQIVRRTDVVHADLPEPAARARRAEAIVALLNFAQSRQARLPAPGGVREFLDDFDDLPPKERRAPAVNGTVVDADELDRPQADGPIEGIDAVRLLTAHSAKGLEFDTVFVTRVHPQHGFPKTNSSDEPSAVADLLEAGVFDGAPSASRERRLAEERRLFYVACTRAQRRLVLLATTVYGRSRSTHFVQELLRGDDVKEAIRVLPVDQVLADAGSDAAPAPGEPLEAAIGGVGVRDRRRDLLARARRVARERAAAALGRAEAAGVDGPELRSAQRELAVSADLLTAVAAIERTGAPPADVAARLDDRAAEVLRRLIEELSRLRDRNDSGTATGPSPWAIRRAQPPLDLSYTAIDTYRRCPRCYYVRYMLDYPGPVADAASIGSSLHRALERFYGEFRAADAAGAAPPGLDRMLALARDEFLAAVQPDQEVDQAALDRTLAQVRLGYERLHRPDIHVLETEHAVRFDYPRGGHSHRLSVKIDRIDQVTAADGSTELRIVDYKTGQAWKKLSKPSRDDLQLGVYLLALRHEYGSDIRGQAEYWLYSTGERGVLRFDEIDEAKVREAIDEVIDGILQGRFERGKNCVSEICEILDPADRIDATARSGRR